MEPTKEIKKSVKEIDLSTPIQPFLNAQPDLEGVIHSPDFTLSGIGELNFYASPNIGAANTSKFFKEPLRVWAELELPEGTEEEEMTVWAMMLSLNVDVRNNQTIELVAEVKDGKIFFDKKVTTDDVTQTVVQNPLIENKEYIRNMTFEMTDALENLQQQVS